MIHNDVLNQLQLLVKTTVPPLVEVAETPAELPHWAAGQKLPAHVLASLPNGRFQVSVGDQVLDMNLPKNTQPGDNVELVYVANQPRLTFLLSRETQSALKTSSAAYAASAARGDLPAGAAASAERAPVTLSDTAKFLGTLLQRVAERQQDAQTPSLVKSSPIVASPPGDSREFAVALRGALSQSGLFYESHQAQWVAGERTLTELLREPQGALSDQAVAKAQAGNVQTPAVDQSQKAQVLVNLQPDNSSAQAGKAAELVHPDALPLIQQQLQTLDTHQLVWQGLVWPGQQMDWVVEERDEHGPSGDGEEYTQWQTKLRLQLPRLGNVSATLAFTSKGLRIGIAAAYAPTLEMLKEGQGRLLKSMDDAGLSLLGVTVEHDDRA